MIRQLDDLQKSSINILKDVIHVFNQLNIPWYMAEGSCLGAVRHSGFIPWDDDIDITIPAYCYEKLVTKGKELLGDKYLVTGAFEQDIYPNDTDVITRIYDRNIKISVGNFKQNDILNHPWVDVSLICGLPDGKVKRKIYFANILFTKALLKMSNRSSIGFNSTKKRGKIEQIILEIIKRIDTSKFFDEQKQSCKIRKLLLKYDINKSNYVVAFTSDYRWKEIMPKKVYGRGVKHQFEDIEVNIPTNSEYYLRQLYGDYMKLPPEEERKGKHTVTIIE